VTADAQQTIAARATVLVAIRFVRFMGIQSSKSEAIRIASQNL
jgi:hypothetical protein